MCDIYGIADYDKDKLHVFSIYQGNKPSTYDSIYKLRKTALSDDVPFKSGVPESAIYDIKDDGLYLMVFRDSREYRLVRIRNGICFILESVCRLALPDAVLFC